MSSKLPVPVPKQQDSRNSSTPMKSGIRGPNMKSPAKLTPSTNKKYSHIQSKVKTFWTAQEKQRAGVKQFFDRKQTSSASTSASSSAATSPDFDNRNKSMSSLQRIHHQLSGADFAARINELRKGMTPVSEGTNNTSELSFAPTTTPSV